MTESHQQFSYDHVYSPETNTEEVYRLQCAEIVVGRMEVYNGTIFAYGQTSSGKAHTLLDYPNTSPGVGILAFDAVFNEIDRRVGNETTVIVAYLELCNESISDLLQEDKDTA